MSSPGGRDDQQRVTPSNKRMANDSTTKANGTQQSEPLDLKANSSKITSNAEQETASNMKLQENNAGEAFQLKAAALDKATSADDDALPNMIENDIHHEMSSTILEEAPSSKLPNQETSSTEASEEKPPDNPHATTSTSSARNDASEGHMALKKDSDNVGFTLSPNLPIEVRLKIWHRTFVKRHVDLDFGPAYEFIMRGDGVYKPVVRYIPVTLAVNRKSRRETLKRYEFVFFPEDEEEIDIRMWVEFNNIGPGWVNPSLDVIVSSEPPVVLMKDAYDSWFNHIASCVYLHSFQELEVRHVRWDEDMEQQTEPYRPTPNSHACLSTSYGFGVSRR
jgi:hypothetical protein